jgi:ubiquinone/menaquinone biosynthesis C-methylase UbiE
MTNPAEWAVALFNRSVLKQEKYRSIVTMLGEVDGKVCLDIGGDNGVISYLLRQRGGVWHSADLAETAVASIRRLVNDNVHQIDGQSTPFADDCFDVVVIVDYLEHIHTDREFCRELARILKPSGTLIVNVPHIKRHSLLNRIRHAIGLTDDKHGHVRPGYTVAGLTRVIGRGFAVQAAKTYSGTFSESIDTLMHAAFGLLERIKRGRSPEATAKGTVVTHDDLQRHRAEFLLLSAVYPVFWLIARLDRLLVLQQGYKLIVKASATKEQTGRAGLAAPDQAGAA